MESHRAREPLPLVVIAHEDPGTAETLRHAVESAAGWRATVADRRPGGLSAALAANPALALIGCGVLAELPAGCRVPLLAIGDDNRPADLRAALAAGARGLLPWPDGAADLPAELARIAAETRPAPSKPAERPLITPVVAVLGVHGGAGTTTVAAHLAAAWARFGPAPVLLADLAGGLGYRLDISPSAPTWSDLAPPAGVQPCELEAASGSAPPEPAPGNGTAPLPVPEAEAIAELPAPGDPCPGCVLRTLRLDGEGLAAALSEPWPGLSVLPLSALIDGGPEPPPDPCLIEAILALARSVYRVVVVDLPPTSGPVLETTLDLADMLVAVGRCESAGVHGLRAALEAWNALGRDPGTGGAVLTWVRSHAPLAPRKARQALGDGLWGEIPAAPRLLATAAEEATLLLDRDELSVVQALIGLANRVIPFPGVAR
jgi:Flp pilus assembly CpaE family ATPase